MRAEFALLAYVALLGWVAPRVLSRGSWCSRAPRWGIVLWQAVSASVVLALLAAGLVVLVPTMRVSGGLGEFLSACLMALRAAYSLPGGALAAAVAALLSLSVGWRVCWCVAGELVAASRARGRHRAILAVIGRPDESLDALVVEHASLKAYCLPGRHRTIVLTSAALRVLDADEISAVLAHERAHLRGRHHLVLATASGLARALPFIPLFHAARREAAVLIEMLADDAATKKQARLVVASALLTLGSASHGAATTVGLAATGTATARRIERLLGPNLPLRRWMRTLLAVGALAAIVVPVALLVLPALLLAHGDYCPLPPT